MGNKRAGYLRNLLEIAVDEGYTVQGQASVTRFGNKGNGQELKDGIKHWDSYQLPIGHDDQYPKKTEAEKEAAKKHLPTHILELAKQLDKDELGTLIGNLRALHARDGNGNHDCTPALRIAKNSRKRKW